MESQQISFNIDKDILAELDAFVFNNKKEIKNRSRAINKALSEFINKYNLEKEVEENGLVNSGK